MTRRSAKERLLDMALTLFLEKGYTGTGVDALCEAAEVSKGSFYHSFGSKEALGLAVLDHYLAGVGKRLDAGSHSTIEDPREQALAFLDHLVAVGARVWFSGCVLGSFALDLAQTSPAIRKAVAERFDTVAEGYARSLEPLFAGPDAIERARELAEHYLVIVEGSIVLAKSYRDPSYVTRALERFRREVREAAGVAV